MQTNNMILFEFINDNSYGCTENILNEDVQIGVTNKILSEILKMTIGKYNKINFYDIEKSKGDITKISFYNNLKECVKSLLDINNSTNAIPDIATIAKAIDNVIALTPNFKKCFMKDNKTGIMIYNCIIYSIMEATSYLIASAIQMTNNDKLVIVKVDDCVLIHAIRKFNNACADNSIIPFIEQYEESKESMNESFINIDGINFGNVSGASKGILDFSKDVIESSGKFAGSHKKFLIGAGILVGAVVIIPIIKEIVYWITKCRHKISDCARIQAEYLKLNIEKLQLSNDEKTVKIIAKESKFMNLFNKIADIFALESDRAQNDSKNDLAKDTIDVSDVSI